MKSKTMRFRPFPDIRRTTCLAAIALMLAFTGMPVNAAVSINTHNLPDSGWFVDMNRFAQSAHAGFKCRDCHGSMTDHGGRHPDPKSPHFLKTPASERYDYSRCQTCHKLSYERYMAGGHAKARKAATGSAKGSATVVHTKKQAPTCGACHASHYDRSKMSRVDVGRRMIDACGRCHPEHTASYLDSIHGKLAANLENPASALCTDCHGAHTVVSLKDPDAALPVCRRCHPKAERQFTNFVIHAAMDSVSGDAPKSDSMLWIYRVKLAAIGVVALSVVFFFGHSFLWLLREVHEKLRKH